MLANFIPYCTMLIMRLSPVNTLPSAFSPIPGYCTFTLNPIFPRFQASHDQLGTFAR